jgi:bacteriorhodopsin
MLDVRGVIPFLWTRYYFVFLFGRDTRAASRAVDFERRAPARWARLAGWVVMLAILGLLALGFLGAARLWRG